MIGTVGLDFFYQGCKSVMINWEMPCVTKQGCRELGPGFTYSRVTLPITVTKHLAETTEGGAHFCPASKALIYEHLASRLGQNNMAAENHGTGYPPLPSRGVGTMSVHSQISPWPLAFSQHPQSLRRYCLHSGLFFPAQCYASSLCDAKSSQADMKINHSFSEVIKLDALIF